ncbi:MAG: CoA transferase [Gammaproteobacteria bacterium]|nr:CoA transferase [Gammaproteobacteria bacterium]MBP6052858.1 CoA transferase [Pseudomonadales bacterium]MBK6582363.1 CoA transferase [Gammaproteobacteria bacterium]MBK7521365.1 CoA transferase [Gammaproteobacteria bacterium]MBK7729144.1 CoA transferase [Gammaproteobacteria bacterium]
MGPLSGMKIVEIAGIGPGPFAAMMLADMGAQVIRVSRPGTTMLSLAENEKLDFFNRGKRSIALNLKDPRAIELVLKMIEGADGLVEGYRPGVMEKLGLGPEICLARNPRLVFGRMTGWGQDGPLAQVAGHDINYIALTGALHAIGEKGGKPVVPLNLVGDFGGGGMLLAFGMVCAMLEAARSGRGQVVDAAMVDGASILMSMVYAGFQSGFWSNQRGNNMLDGGAHFYGVYETADNKYVSIGSIEPQFYALLLEKLEIDAGELPHQMDARHWDALRERFTALFRTRTRAQWCALMEGSDICFAPVLGMDELTSHPHMKARGTFVETEGVWQPAPAPRFSRSVATLPAEPRKSGADTDAILAELGCDEAQRKELRDSAVVG